MDPKPKDLMRFNPNRFTPETRKQVHWSSGSEVTNPSKPAPPKKLSQTTPSSSGTRPAAHWFATAYGVLKSWFPVLVIVSYLLIRDGWFILFANSLSSSMVYIGLPARWFRSALTPSSMSPSDVKQFVDHYLQEHLWGPPMRDYALSADGALVYTPFTFPPDNPSLPAFSRPTIALTDDNQVGHCWHVSDTQAQLGITLPELIFPTNVTIDHIPLHLTADLGRAPRSLVLWGVVDGDGNRERYLRHVNELRANQSLERHSPLHKGGDDLFFVLAEFSFDIHGTSHIQTFPVQSVAREVGIYVGTVVLEVLDNWGAASTCLYRIRVHGVSTVGDML